MRTLGEKQIIFLPVVWFNISRLLLRSIISFSIDSFFSIEIFEKFYRIGIKFKQ